MGPGRVHKVCEPFWKFRFFLSKLFYSFSLPGLSPKSLKIDVQKRFNVFRHLEEASKAEHPRAPKSGPRAVQERPKSVPRAPQERPRVPKRAPRGSQERPRGAQEWPKSAQNYLKSFQVVHNRRRWVEIALNCLKSPEII